jgi:hypothetical protein
MKKLTLIPHAFKRVLAGYANEQDQLVVCLILFTILMAAVLTWGHSGQYYYYDKY